MPTTKCTSSSSQGAGRAFCAGYDMKDSAESADAHEWLQNEMPWDPMVDYR